MEPDSDAASEDGPRDAFLGDEPEARASRAVTLIQLPSLSDARGITGGPDGNIWFTETEAGKLGRSTLSGTITEYAPPTTDSEPWGITSGPDGNLWFTECTGDKIGRSTPSGVITEFDLPERDGCPGPITQGPDGNLWFGETFGEHVGRITPDGVVTEFAVRSSGVVGIATGKDGALWFALSGITQSVAESGTVGRITTTGVITYIDLPPGCVAEGMAFDRDGDVWFGEGFAWRLGRLSAGGSLTRFTYTPPSSCGSGTYEVTRGPDGAIWFGTIGCSLIGRMDGAGSATMYHIPVYGPLAITAGADGDLWFTTAASSIGHVKP
jgi:virginiamycin B lyase